jgi:putative toxin-antitoxin system antitoxin component (TIGR02293 family)
MKNKAVQIEHNLPIISLPDRGTMELLNLVTKGVSASVLTQFARALNFSMSQIARLVGMSPKELDRKLKNNEVLDADATERTLYLISVYDELMEYFEDSKKAQLWLSTPRKALEGKSPNELLKTRAGVDVVLNAISVMKHGFVG